MNYFNIISDTNVEHVRVDAGTGLMKEATHIALLDKDPMHDGGDSGSDPDKYLASILQAEDNLDAGVLPVRGGEQAVHQSAPGAATEEYAGQGFWTNGISTQVRSSGDELFLMPEPDPTGNLRSVVALEDCMDDFASFEDFRTIW